MKLLVIGCGYVGLVMGACFAEMGHHVSCLDTDKEKVDSLKQGVIPIFEPGLEELVHRNISAQRLAFTSDYPLSIESAEICFIAVDTPATSQGIVDLRHVQSAMKAIGEHMTEDKLVAIKSTVPIGTFRQMRELLAATLAKRGITLECAIVSNPEFLKEGNAVQDFMRPDRIILGSDSESAIQKMKEAYAPFVLNHERFLIMDNASAEMTKYAANAMLATRISLMNELASLCEFSGANIHMVRQGIGSDSRIGYGFLYAGAGFGGSCLPKDLRALQHYASSLGSPLKIVEAAASVNDQQKQLLGNKIQAYFASRGGIKGKTIAILGVSFKPNTDDIREAPSLVLIEQLLHWGCLLRLFDPAALHHVREMMGENPAITYCSSEGEAAQEADALALVTEWKQFRFLDFPALLSAMRGKAFFDGRILYHPNELDEVGFEYIPIA